MTPDDDDLACNYVLDRLEPEVRQAFVARLNVDPELRGRVRAYEAGLAARLAELPTHVPSASAWARIAQAAGAPRQRRAGRWLPVLKWGLAAVIAASLASLAVERWIARPYVVILTLDSRSSRPVRVAAAEAGDANASFRQLALLASARWDNPADRQAFALFDPATSQGFIAVRSLPEASAGTRYQVWIVDTATGSARAAGALPTPGLYSFAVDPIADTRTDHLRVLVTREAASAPAIRPGPNVILGG